MPRKALLWKLIDFATSGNKNEGIGNKYIKNIPKPKDSLKVKIDNAREVVEIPGTKAIILWMKNSKENKFEKKFPQPK